MSGDYEARARARKAGALVAVIDAHGGASDEAALLDEDHRRIAEQLAGIRTASDETWEMVIAILRGSESVRPDPDPFAGLPGT